MLLAAGFGTRLQPYSLYRPKPLFPVLNKPLLLILVEMLQQAGFDRIIVNGHHLSRQIRGAVTGIPGILFQHEPEILGTGGSLRKALERCAPEPLLVMNGDICHDIDIGSLYQQHILAGNDVTMALHDLPRFNTVTVRDDSVVTFRSGREHELDCLAYTGVQVVNPGIISRIPSPGYYHIIDFYEEQLSQGLKIGFVRVDGRLWHDIGTPEDYLNLHRELLTGPGDYQLPLPRPRETWVIHTRARIGDNVRFAGWGCIGSADIGADVMLKNCVVWDNAVIPEGTHLENALVTDKAR